MIGVIHSSGKKSQAKNLLKIYQQLNEPSDKNGLWVKTDSPANKVQIRDKNYITEIKLKDLPISSGDNLITARVESEIYLFSPYEGTYKFLTNTNEYVKIKEVPFPHSYGICKAVAVDTNIYLLGGESSPSYLYKYDTLTDTYTKLANAPTFPDGNAYAFQYSSAAAIDTNIYMFGCSIVSTEKLAVKYDTLKNSYERLADIPYTFDRGSVESVGTDCYLFGGSDYKRNAYKYNSLTNEYTKLTNIPYDFYSGATTIKRNGYLFSRW